MTGKTTSHPVAARVERSVVRVHGPDALTYLHGQLSQDLVALPVGASAWSLLLTPKGRIEVWMRVTRVGEHDLVLDADLGATEALVARLERFKLRTDATIEALDWQAVSVRGPGAAAVTATDDGTLTLDAAWNGHEGVDLVGPTVSIPPGVTEVSSQELDRLRVEAAMPRMGAEISPDTIPAEMGQAFIDSSVSFTKGCYVGQELVARMNARDAAAPRRLVRVTGSNEPPLTPTPLIVDHSEKGPLTSVAATTEGWTGLALLARSVDTPADAHIGEDAVVAISAL